MLDVVLGEDWIYWTKKKKDMAHDLKKRPPKFPTPLQLQYLPTLTPHHSQIRWYQSLPPPRTPPNPPSRCCLDWALERRFLLLISLLEGVFLVAFLASPSALKCTMSILSSRRARLIIWRPCAAFLGLSKTWDRSSLCLKLQYQACMYLLSKPGDFSMPPPRTPERGAIESVMTRLSFPSMLAWLRLLGAEGWRVKRGAVISGGYFVIVPWKIFWSSKERCRRPGKLA